MKGSLFFLGALVIAIVIFGSCENNNEEELYADLQEEFCDTANMSFTSDILPILDNKCIGCHNVQNMSGDVLLDSYTEIKKQVDNGKLWGTINHETGFEPMPLNQAKLPDCDLNKIKAWIDTGAPNN